MLVTGSAPNATVDLGGAHTQALLKEARRRRRRRWARRLLVGIVVLGVAAVVAVLTISGARSPSGDEAATAGALPNGSLATLHVAGPLAVAPDGALYVADVGSDRILVRLPDGRFRVVAGTGVVGFSGDGGSALHAELAHVSDLVFAPDGTLYFADGGRVRAIARNGVIRTLAGDGHAPRAGQRIANGMPARSAPLGSISTLPRWQSVIDNPLSIALSPTTGQLYISTGPQILRLTAAGTLDPVRAVVPSGTVKGPLGDIGPIVIDAHGNIDVGGGDYGWSLWQIAPSGIARYVGFARLSGGDYAIVARGPGGAIYASTRGIIARVETDRLVPVESFGGPLRGQAFPLTYFAFGPHGTIYADDYPGGTAFEAHQQLRLRRSGRISLLWQETNDTPN
jgi:hypothetical protein